jgi:hypothetical protein
MEHDGESTREHKATYKAREHKATGGRGARRAGTHRAGRHARLGLGKDWRARGTREVCAEAVQGEEAVDGEEAVHGEEAGHGEEGRRYMGGGAHR